MHQQDTSFSRNLNNNEFTAHTNERARDPSDFSWKMKLGVAMLVDTFDMTIGRLLFPTPFLGEIVGTAVCWLMFGPKALCYSWELLDPTEQLDGFVPTATMIALMARND